MMVETDKCKFFVIACYAKEKDGSLRQKDEFVGYWYCPLIGESLKDLVHAKHYASFEEAETVCNEINNDDRFFYGKIKRYEVRLNEPMCTGSGTDEFQREPYKSGLVADVVHQSYAVREPDSLIRTLFKRLCPPKVLLKMSEIFKNVKIYSFFLTANHNQTLVV